MHLQPGQSESDYYEEKFSGVATAFKAPVIAFANITANLRLQEGVPMYGHESETFVDLNSTDDKIQLPNIAQCIACFNLYYYWNF